MDLSKIDELIEIMDKSHLSAIRLSEGDSKIELERNASLLNNSSIPMMAERVGELLAGKTESNEASIAFTEANEGEIIVRSPTVGMFYVAPSPEEDPFVKPGQEVLSGQTLAVVEAMKVLNEVGAPAPGIVSEVLAANGTQVEYDQPLFRIKTSELTE